MKRIFVQDLFLKWWKVENLAFFWRLIKNFNCDVKEKKIMSLKLDLSTYFSTMDIVALFHLLFIVMVWKRKDLSFLTNLLLHIHIFVRERGKFYIFWTMITRSEHIIIPSFYSTTHHKYTFIAHRNNFPHFTTSILFLPFFVRSYRT